MKKTKKVVVVMNEQHTLLDEQKKILDETFKTYDFLLVPASGWTLEEMERIQYQLRERVVVFVSPVPYLLACAIRWTTHGALSPTATKVYLFHNDRREKKELPDGRVIQVVAPTGWQLVKV